MPIYNFAGITMDISTHNKNFIDRMSSFLVESNIKVDIKVDIIKNDSIEKPKGTLILDEGVKWIKRTSDDGYSAYISIYEEEFILVAVHADNEWEKVIIEYAEEDVELVDTIEKATEYFLSSAIGIILKNKILFNNGLVAHAPSIEHDGKGILLVIQPGSDKSLNTKMWEQFKDDLSVICDDSSALRIINEKTYLYSTPWNCSSERSINRNALLGAIVIFEQGRQNTINLITKAEAAERLLPRMMFPYFDECLMLQALNIFEKIISGTSVYLFRGLPDKESMELVYECMR